MQNLEPGQIVELNGKDATVITVGDGVVHLEQDGESISVHPDQIQVRGASEAFNDLLRMDNDHDSVIAEIVSLKQRVTALEAQANRIDKVLAALTAGPGKGPQENGPQGGPKEPSTGNSTAAPGETPAATAPADSAAEAGNAALPASE